MPNKLFNFSLGSKSLFRIPVVSVFFSHKAYVDFLGIRYSETLLKIALFFLQLDMNASEEGIKQIRLSVFIKRVFFSIQNEQKGGWCSDIEFFMSNQGVDISTEVFFKRQIFITVLQIKFARVIIDIHLNLVTTYFHKLIVKHIFEIFRKVVPKKGVDSLIHFLWRVQFVKDS